MSFTDNRARVWAPRARRLDLVAHGRREPMTRADGGWWTWPAALAAGTDYAFSIDGGAALPDPRSPWQPAGPHGPSRTVDHSAFRWTDHAWAAPPLASALIYELHTGTFTPEGTFDAITGKLDHLAGLGVTHLELMPVAEFEGDRGWGYDGVDLYAPHHAYGGPDALKRLVNACHERGLAVLMDVVYNHFGPSGNYWNRFGPYTTNRHRTPWGAAVNLDGAGSFEVRRYLCDNAALWLRDYHMDGLRLDSVPSLIDSSPVHILQQLSAETAELSRQLGRPLVLIGESDLNDPRVVTPREAGGCGLDAQWSDDLHHAIHSLLTGERQGYYQDFGGFAHLAKAIEKVFVIDGGYCGYRKCRYGHPAGNVPRHRFVVYTQTHDQAGNRAAGDRLCHLVSPTRARIAAALALLGPDVPMLFQGEEWAASAPFPYFTDHREPRMARSIAAARRAEYAEWDWPSDRMPDPQLERTFLLSKPDWTETTMPVHGDMLAWYRRLAALRRAIPAEAQPRVAFDENGRWMRVERGPLTIAFNLGGEPVTMPAAGALDASAGPVRYESGVLELAPEALAILTRIPPAASSPSRANSR